MPLPTARAAARDIAAGRLSAVALLDRVLDRIDAREATVGAWEYLDRDGARAAAQRADSLAPTGPLHGIPIAVKDLIDTADMPTGYGSPIYAGHRPAADAACVALARAAGAIVLGKTVTTEFACFTPGKTTNPHNPSHTPGGSSSGSAAAVGAGMVPLAFGTQTAGSVIRPAAFCGCVGFKPSFGLIPRAGVKPLCDSLDTVGVFAADVADAAFFAGAITGRPGLREATAAAAPCIGLHRTAMWPAAEPVAAAAFEQAGAALARAGARVVEIAAPPEHEGLTAAQETVMGYELAQTLTFEWRQHRAALSPKLARLIESGAAVSPAAYDEAVLTMRSARRRLGSFFGECDAVLTPAAPGAAPAGLDATGDPVFSRMWTLLGVPCLALPAGRANGLPLAVQLIGRVGGDNRLIAAALFAERALGAAA